MKDKENLTLDETFDLAEQNHKKNNLNFAQNLYNDVLKKDTNYLPAHNNLGILLNQIGEYQRAINCFKNAIRINPNYESAHNNLGFLHFKKEEYQKAVNCYKKATQINPNYADAYYNLGNTYKKLKEFKKAVSCFKKTIEINPNYFVAYYNLGNTFREIEDRQKAVNCYEKTIQINPNYVDAYNNLGTVFNELGQNQKAIYCYERALQINPKYIDAYNNLGNTFRELGEHQKAVNCYEKAIEIEPENITSHWLSMNTFPTIYENLDEINYYNKRFQNSIKKINNLLDSKSEYSKKLLVDALLSSTNFYLHYQGRDIFNLQTQYANLVERITKKIYEEFHQERKKNTSSKQLKIGFVSSYFRHHTVFKLFKNWPIKLDQKCFKKYVYYCGNKFDQSTNEIKNNVDYFFNNNDINSLITQISQDKLDVLIYLDIGMRPKIQIMSSLRLAPIQCSTWGHPITSGFKNIDYFFSSELMEVQNSQKNYTEKLINFPGLGIDYDFPDLLNIKKPNIPKNANSTIFLNLQSLFKLLPQDDHIYLDIIKKIPNSYFWFIENRRNLITTSFKNRISKLFQENGYSFEKYFYFHPKCSQDEFFGLIYEADIILDSLNWSGGNTSLEAISLNKPIVTYPSDYMRGRHTYAILKHINIDETIANSKEKYVDIAVKLAVNVNFRSLVINKIKKNKDKLYKDDKVIKFFNNLLLNKLKN